MRTICVICLIAIVQLAPASGAELQREQQAADDREITLIRGDLYRVRDGRQFTTFLVTSEGIVLCDPLSQPTAMWLKEELAVRFPGRPVKYVLLTHHHFDRAEGAAAFFPPAERIAHRDFNAELSKSRRSLPAFLARVDYNLNGMIESAELNDVPQGRLLLAKDRNADGILTAQELYQRVNDVRNSYTTRTTITLGDKTVELIHPGVAHAADMTVVHYRDERVVFAADPPPVNVVPFSFGSVRPHDLFEWVHTITALDFDTLLFSNGETMTRTALVALAGYLDALRTDVVAGFERGDSLADLQAAGVPATHQGDPNYANRVEQLSEVYRTIKLLRVDVSGVAITNYARRHPHYCALTTLCAAGGAVPAGTAAAALLVGKQVGIVVEATLSGQSWASRRTPLYVEEIAIRQSLGSLLFRYSPARASRMSFVLLGGGSYVSGSVRGMNLVQGAVTPTGGRHSISADESRLGITVGTDLSWRIARTLTVIAPVRATRVLEAPPYWPGSFNVRAGIGVAMRVLRHVG